MKRSLRALLPLLTAGLLLGLASCSSCSRPSVTGGASSSAPAQFYTPPGTVFDVTYTPNTVRIDLPTAQKTLQSVSDDGRVFLFDASDSRIRELAEGKVMFLEHLAIRRVIGVLNQGSQIAVATDSAALTDFIQDGDIQFSVPIDFKRRMAQAAPGPAGKDVLTDLTSWFGPPSVYAAEGASMSMHAGGEIDDWEFEVEGEPEGDGLALKFEAAKKKIMGMRASINAKGKLSHLDTAFKVAIHHGKVEDFQYKTPIQGKLDVTWAVLTDGANAGIGEARLKLPPFWKDVIDIYGLPFLFQANAGLIFKPGFGGKKDSAEGGLHITYDGDGGLSVHGAQSAPQGKISGEPSLDKTTAESLAPHGVVLAVSAPKISVSLGTESFKEAIKQIIPQSLANKAAEALEKGPLARFFGEAKKDFFKIEGAAYLQLVTEFDYAGSGPLSVVPCSMTHLNLAAEAGADASFLALKAESPKLTLFKSHMALRDPDIPACGEK